MFSHPVKQGADRESDGQRQYDMNGNLVEEDRDLNDETTDRTAEPDTAGEPDGVTESDAAAEPDAAHDASAHDESGAHDGTVSHDEANDESVIHDGSAGYDSADMAPLENTSDEDQSIHDGSANEAPSFDRNGVDTSGVEADDVEANDVETSGVDAAVDADGAVADRSDRDGADHFRANDDRVIDQANDRTDDGQADDDRTNDDQANDDQPYDSQATDQAFDDRANDERADDSTNDVAAPNDPTAPNDLTTPNDSTGPNDPTATNHDAGRHDATVEDEAGDNTVFPVAEADETGTRDTSPRAAGYEHPLDHESVGNEAVSDEAVSEPLAMPYQNRPDAEDAAGVDDSTADADVADGAVAGSAVAEGDRIDSSAGSLTDPEADPHAAGLVTDEPGRSEVIDGVLVDDTADAASDRDGTRLNDEQIVDGSVVESVTNGDLRPGDAPVPEAVTAAQRTDNAAIHARWQQAQLGFIDDPRGSAVAARAIADEVIETQIQTLRSRLSALDAWQQQDSPDTEVLRAAMQQYRALFTSLLGDE